ncbi:hypothetical protein ROSMUCSMR3_02923 [Roseovarius mucosus]|uniref:Uncharacterized protein n=1 Tax=Roseovarius mucosus TaxID=215743 RepID=A0A1V0RRJ2_9RHOB|nr:hypothetical protein [Roseovarius mucosus]ARE84390.1 hypothetical protein ROSMUCSMR3_02923 [Roseovarius mucosus]
MSENTISNKDSIPEFGRQTLENQVNPTDLVPPSPSILDTMLNLAGTAPAILFGLGMVIFLFSALTGRPNWGILVAMLAAGYVLTQF